MSAVQGHQLETQAYIRLLRSENSALRKQIEDSVEATARARSPELPTYDDVDLIDFLQRQCQELNAERDILLAEVTKLKNTPCNDTAHANAFERVAILSKQLSDARDFEDKEKQLMRDRIQELEQAYCQHATEIEEERSPVEESGWTLVQSSPRSKAFDLAAFVGDIWKHQVVIPKKYEGPFSDIEDLQVPKEAGALMPHGYLSFSGAQIIWRSAGAELFVGLVPKQVAKSIDGGRNIRWEDNIIQRHLGVRSAGQRREMLFLHNHTWHYYGQYECVGSVPLTAKQVEGLGYKKMIPYVILRTLIDSYGAVPRTKDRIFDQYSQGQLKIQCFAFKRVAFNEPLNKFLTKNGVWSSP